MATRGKSSTHTVEETAPRARPLSWRERIGARLRDDHQEDGVFRPVRLPFWTDLAISVAIIAFMAGTFAGFIVFLARTQGR